MNVFYDDAYVGAGYAFETTRKAKWVTDSLASDPMAGVHLLAPRHLTWDDVVEVHHPDYARAVQTGRPLVLAQSQGFVWDAGLWPMVLATNGGMLAAVFDALRHGVSGSLSSGLHHARRDRGAGYCTFNGLVLAARRAVVAATGPVLILDLDAHAGGGSAELIANDATIWQVDVSVDSYDSYPSTARASLHVVERADDYLPRIETCLMEIERQMPPFALCLYNAGMDPFEGCGDGGLPGINRDVLAARERMVFEWCARQHLPVAFALAGGYIGDRLDRDGLVGLHRLTLAAATGFAAGRR